MIRGDSIDDFSRCSVRISPVSVKRSQSLSNSLEDYHSLLTVGPLTRNYVQAMYVPHCYETTQRKSVNRLAEVGLALVHTVRCMEKLTR